MGNDPRREHFDKDGRLYSDRFGDYYFSRHDGRAECAHVFLGGNNLPSRWFDRNDFTIGELGFGTGLNFLETWSRWQQTRRPGQHLSFVSIEAYPLKKNVVGKVLSTWPELETLADRLLNKWPRLGAPIAMDQQTTLDVRLGDVGKMLVDFPLADAWYLDGFSPAKNPQMWSHEVITAVSQHTSAGGTFASFTSAGWVRRNLAAAGFTVEKRPGFGSKRDMIAGFKP